MSEYYCHLHKRLQDNCSNKTELNSYVSFMKDIPSQEQVSCGQQKCCDHLMSGDYRQATRSYIVNNIPAHMPQAHSVSLHHHQQQQQNPRYLAMPSSHIVKHMEDVPMYERVEPPRNFHGYSSLDQSTPRHSQPFHYSRFSNNQHQQRYNNQHQQRIPLEHLDMSSQGPFSTYNDSSHVASAGSNSTSFINYRSLNCSTVEDETDQPLNLSLKQQDVSSNTSFSSGNAHMPYDFLPPNVGGSNFRPHMVPENMRPAMKGNRVLQNNLVANVNGSSTSFSSTGASTRRPVPNLAHSHIDTPHGYQSFKVPYQHSAPQTPQFMTPQAPYTNSLFHPRRHPYPGHSAHNPCSNLRPNDAMSHSGYSSRHSAHNPYSNLRPNDAVSRSGCSSEGKLYNTGADQLHTMQTAHQNALDPRLVQQFNSTYAETDLDDLVVNDLTNFSHQHKDILENSFCDGRREQLANYSVNFHESGKSVDQDVGKYRDDRQCVNYKNAGPRRTHNFSSNCDPIKTFSTDSTPNLSTATSITGLTPARKVERDDKAIGMCKQIKSTSETNSIVSSTDMVAATISGSQPQVRQTEVAAIAACTGQELGAAFPKCTSQPADDHVVQENFYSDLDFNEGALDQATTYYEEGTPSSFSSLSSHSSQLCADPREATAMMELTCSDETNTPKSVVGNKRAACPISQPASNFRHPDTDETLKRNLELLSVACHENNQVEGTPLMFSRSSTPESLNSCDTQPILSSVASEYSWKASGVVSPSEIPDSPSELEPTHSPTKRFKHISITTKYTNVITKQSLTTQGIVMAESWGIVPTVDENSSSLAVHRKQEDSHLMFSVLQKNILSTNRNQNQVLNSQAGATQMIEEHVETEYSSGKPEVFVVHAKKKIPQDCSETACLSTVTFASSLTRDVSEHSEVQDEPQEPSLPTVEERESGLQVAGFSEGMESKPAKDVVKHEDPNTSVSNEDSDSSVSGETSMSDVSQEEEEILAQCIRIGMPAPVSSVHKIKCKRQFRVKMQASSNLCSDNPARMPSVLKSVPKKLAPLFNSPPDNITGDNNLVDTEDCPITGDNNLVDTEDCPITGDNNLVETEDCPITGDNNLVDTEDCPQLDIPQDQARWRPTEHNGKTDRSPSRDSRLSDSSCSSTTLPVAHFNKTLKKIGGKIESPESRVRLGAVFELSDECSVLEQAYFQSVPLQLRSAV